MKIASTEKTDLELMDEFCSDFQEKYERCQQISIALEQTPNDTEALRELFRNVHTVKGNLIYIGLKALTPLLQNVEDLLDQVRNNLHPYDALLSDVILLALDNTKALVDENFDHAPCTITEESFASMCASIREITQSSHQQGYLATLKAIRRLDPSTALKEPSPQQSRSKPANHHSHLLFLSNTERLGATPHADIAFIRSIIPALEERTPFLRGAAERTALLALLMNREAGSPEDPTQLLMAALSRDIATSFLPLELLHKKSPLTTTERALINGHVSQATQLLRGLGKWQEASLMVEQHHERADGSGYPNQLTLSAITPGARILAIADAFEACSHPRPYRTQQERPIMRAIMEINRCADSLFDDQWVTVFNRVARDFINHYPE